MNIEKILEKIRSGSALTRAEQIFAQKMLGNLSTKLNANGQLEDVEDTVYNTLNQYLSQNPTESSKEVSGDISKTTKQQKSQKIANAPTMQDLINKVSANNTAKIAQKQETDKKILKTSTVGNYATDAVKGVAGLAQFIKGRKIQKNAVEPKTPKYIANSMLATRLAEAGRQAQMEDPIIREQAIKDLANQRLYMDNIGKSISGGDVSGYGAFAQQNASNERDAIRKLVQDSVGNKMQKQSIYDNLLAQSQAERQFEFGDKVRQYRVDMGKYNNELDYGQNLVDSGVSNMMGSLGNMVSNSPALSYLNAMKMKKDISQQGRAKGKYYPKWDEVSNW